MYQILYHHVTIEPPIQFNDSLSYWNIHFLNRIIFEDLTFEAPFKYLPFQKDVQLKEIIRIL